MSKQSPKKKSGSAREKEFQFLQSDNLGLSRHYDTTGYTTLNAHKSKVREGTSAYLSESIRGHGFSLLRRGGDKAAVLAQQLGSGRAPVGRGCAAPLLALVEHPRGRGVGQDAR